MSPVSNPATLGRWLTCNGASVPAQVYTDLYNTIGTQYGSAAPGYFNLPNLTDRFPIGAGSNALNTTGGSSSQNLDTNSLASHDHPVTDLGHIHTNAANHAHGYVAVQNRVYIGANGASFYQADMETTGTTDVGYANFTSSITGVNLGLTGSDQAFPILNPFLSLKFAIAY